MRSSKFNRNRSLDPWRKYLASQNKTRYRIDKGNVRVLSSLRTENQTWGALHKAWKGYQIGLNKFEREKMRYYARVIQKLQNELGLQVSSFPDLNVFPFEGAGYSQDGDITTYYDVDYVSKQEMKEW
jgi:hypothetical protein